MAKKVTETMGVSDFRVDGILIRLQIGSTGVFNDGMSRKLAGLGIVLIDVFKSGVIGLLAKLESELTCMFNYEVARIVVKLRIALIDAFNYSVTGRLFRLESVPLDVVNCGVSRLLIKLNTELMSPFDREVAGVFCKIDTDSMNVNECRVDGIIALLNAPSMDEFKSGLSEKCDKGDVKSKRHLYRIIEDIFIQTNALECSHFDILSMSKKGVCSNLQIVSNDRVEHFANFRESCATSKSIVLHRSYIVGCMFESMKENKCIDILIPCTYRCKYENDMSSLILGITNQSRKIFGNIETESDKIARHCNGFIPSTIGYNYGKCMLSFTLDVLNPLRVMFENTETELDKRMHYFCKPLCTLVSKMEIVTSLVMYKDCRPMNNCSTSSKMIEIRIRNTHFSNVDYFIYIICIMFILTSDVCLKLLRNIICRNILENFFLHSPKLSKLKNKDIEKALLRYLLNYKAPGVQQDLHVYPVSRQSIDYTLAIEPPGHSSLSIACMSNELIRVSTFSNFPQTGTSLIQLAAAGFYHSEEHTGELICYSCGLRVKGWRTGANPLNVHKQLAPGCEHVREIISPDPTEYLNKAESRAQSDERHDVVYEHQLICTDSGNNETLNNNLVSSSDNCVRNSRSTSECQLYDTSDKTSPPSLILQSHNMSVSTTDLASYASHIGHDERYGSTSSQSYSNTGSSHLTRSSSSDSGFGSELSLSNPLLGNGNRASQFPSREQPFGQCTNNERTENRTRYQRQLSMDGNINVTDNIERLSLITEEPQAYSFRGLDHARQDHGNFQGSNKSNPFPNSPGSLKKKYPEYESLQKRRESFKDWPANKNFLHVYDLAQCGFFFTNHGDCVRCFDCGIGLRNWEREDNVWIEHARWSRNCPYILQLKGQKFMDSVLKLFGIDETTRHNSNIEKEAGSIATEYNAAPRNPLDHTAARYVLTERIFEDEELVKLCMQTLLQSIGWDSITNEILVSSILEIVTERDSSNMVNTNELPIMTGDEGYSTQHSSTQQSIVYQSKGDDIVNESSTKEQTSTGIYTERKAKLDDDRMKIEKENEELRDLYTCKICLDEKVGITFVPCGHLVTCQKCSPKLRKCPLCRTYIRGTIKTTI